MIQLPGGTFLMGTEDDAGFPLDGEGPVREVTLKPFRIDPYPVTNEDFVQFVDAAGYRTEAERFGWSFVFLVSSAGASGRGHRRRRPLVV